MQPCKEYKQQSELQDIHCSSTHRPISAAITLQAHRCLPASAHTHLHPHTTHTHICLFWAALWSADMQGRRKEREAWQQEEDRRTGSSSSSTEVQPGQTELSRAEPGRVTEHPVTIRWIPLVLNCPVQTVEVLARCSEVLPQVWAF